MSMRTLTSVLIFAACAMTISHIWADTVITKEGKELKGIVVEEYRDRITFSTIDGEMSVMKQEIEELYYDSEEDNLIKLGEQAQERGEYQKAFAYYDKAYRINPSSKKAKDGIVLLQGYLYRKEEALKEAAVMQQADFERRGGGGYAEAPKSDELELVDEIGKLKAATGMTLEAGAGGLKVVDVKASSPSEVAEVSSDDRLVAVWGKLTGYMSLSDVIDSIMKRSSMEIRCTIERDLAVPVKPGMSLFRKSQDLIDAALSMEFEGLSVASVVGGGSADTAGLKPGDLIISIDGKATRYMPLKRALRAIKYDQGKEVVFSVRRDIVIWRKQETI